MLGTNPESDNFAAGGVIIQHVPVSPDRPNAVVHFYENREAFANLTIDQTFDLLEANGSPAAIHERCIVWGALLDLKRGKSYPKQGEQL